MRPEGRGPSTFLFQCGRASSFRVDIGRTASPQASGDAGPESGGDVAHGSDSVESAAREISIYFTKDEIVAFELASQKWITE